MLITASEAEGRVFDSRRGHILSPQHFTLKPK